MDEITMLKLFYFGGAFLEVFLGFVITRKFYPEFRFKKTVLRVFAIVLCVLYMCLCTWNMWNNYISATAIPFLSVGFACIYWLFWHSDFFGVLLLQLFYSTSVSIIRLPLLTLKGIFFRETVVQVNQGHREVWEAVSIYLIVLMISMLWKRYQMVESTLHRLLSKNRLLCALITTSEWLVLDYGMNKGDSGFETTNLLFNLLFVLCVAMVIVSLTVFVTYQQMKSEAVLQQAAYELLKSQYYELSEQQEANCRWVHDTKHELLYIGSYLEANNVSKAYEALQGYLQEIRETEKKVWSGFSFLDFMLNYKKAEMDKKEIEFILDVELQQITIPEEDLVIMLGNLLDNAIEAAWKCEKSRRYIKLKICNLNEMLLLSIDNSNNEIPRLKGDTFISSKKDKGVHGLGIESVKRIVESYDGEIHFEYTEKDFQVQILI